jgi:RNA polymerase sigma-70 factor (ECF subfamily)
MPLFSRLYNLAYWLARDRASAEDLVQETYMKALRGFSSFQPGTNFRAWIYRILRNTFLTSQAGLQSGLNAPLSLDDAEEPLPEPADLHTPESILLLRAEQDQVRRALEALSVPAREIILLSDFEEMTYSEIGLALGIPPGTVMSRLSRARKAMRTLLAAQMEGSNR